MSILNHPDRHRDGRRHEGALGMVSTVIHTGIVFATGVLVGLGLAWRRSEALRETVRTAERKLDMFRTDDIQTWLDDIGPVTPPDTPADIPGIIMVTDDDEGPDPAPVTDPHYWEQ